MSLLLKLELGFFVLLFLCVVVALIRSNKIIIRYAFVWFFVGFMMLIAVLFPELLLWLSNVLGFQSLMNMLFLFGILLLMIVCISLTVILSSQTRKIRLLIQEISMLKEKNNEKDN